MYIDDEIQNITVDVDKMAEGVMNMIIEHPNGGCMVLGMFPAEIMQSLENGLRVKIDREETVRAIMKSISCKVLNLAKAKGICIV